MSLLSFKIYPFSKSFELKNFDCGVTILNDYLIKYATQDLKRYLTAVYVCTLEDQKEIIGYYTLSSNRIDLSELPKDYTKKLPCYPYLPATLIGRLAIDLKYQKKKIGEFLLMDALCKSYKSEIAAFAVIVEAKNREAKNFYKNYGFNEFLDNSNKLFLPMNKIAKLFL
ncbi:MAG TPA: GNAT family N-acetyltransferase [Rickettsia endosymbiont of Omalisus fontisbellaquei]|nr:GNAT family N-acetyltransferase [Rickettsia endosymbiont of Omalisus fontisbellaquei]